VKLHKSVSKEGTKVESPHAWGDRVTFRAAHPPRFDLQPDTQEYDAAPCLQPVSCVFISNRFSKSWLTHCRLLGFQHSSRFLTNTGCRLKSSFWFQRFFICWRWGRSLEPDREVWSTV